MNRSNTKKKSSTSRLLQVSNSTACGIRLKLFLHYIQSRIPLNRPTKHLTVIRSKLRMKPRDKYFQNSAKHLLSTCWAFSVFFAREATNRVHLKAKLIVDDWNENVWLLKMSYAYLKGVTKLYSICKKMFCATYLGQFYPTAPQITSVGYTACIDKV